MAGAYSQLQRMGEFTRKAVSPMLSGRFSFCGKFRSRFNSPVVAALGALCYNIPCINQDLI